MIFNTHSHINDKLENLNELVDECLDSKVDKIAVVGYDLSSSLRAIKASEHPNVYAIVGLQPNEVSSFDGNYDAFIDLFNNEKCIGIGEIGLDYYWNKDEKEIQMKAFEKQLQMASNYKKPVIIHCRDAYEDTFDNIANLLGISDKTLLKAVDILEQLDLIVTDRAYRVKDEEGKYHTPKTIFANTYKREREYLLASGDEYCRTEIENRAKIINEYGGNYKIDKTKRRI